MTTHELDTERSPIDGGEVMFLLLKHRWKLILCILAGLGAAAYVYFNHQPPYESQAKLLVRYVLERSPIDTVEQVGNGGRNSEGVIDAEKEILGSWDLAHEVATKIGPERLANNGATPTSATEAAAKIRDGVLVTSSKGSNVITVAYRHPDPTVAEDVLEALLNSYFEKHLNLHRSVGTFEFVAEQKAQVAERLKDTERQLNELKAQAQVISLPEINAAINDALTRSQTNLEVAEVELAEQLARVQAIEELLGNSSNEAAADAPKPTQGEIQQYNAIVARLGVLRREGLDLLSRYTPESRLVKINRDQIRRLEDQRMELEKRLPTLAMMGAAEGSTFASQGNLMQERARLAAIKGRTEALRSQVEEVRERAKELSQFGPLIAQLERQRLVEEENYKYFEATLERARIDEALDPSKIPNISIVQRPSPAATVEEEINKQIAMLAGGGAVIGLGLVFLLGFVFDRSVKRPMELQRKLGLNHLLAIPYVKRGSLRALSGTSTPLLTSGAEVKDRDTLSKARMEEFVGPYCEAICDRLIHTFQIEGKTHKPKLVAVTSCHNGAGTSTIAAGLAAALSRTGDGKVLLVDMNTRRTDHKYYFGGKHVSSLVDVLQENSTAKPAAENLYLATVSSNSTAVGAARPLPVRFHSLLPRLKHSEFDYVIFDMPPADDTSATLAIAGFVDKVFLVIEAEKTTREAARRAHSELVSMRADTSILVNKTRQYGPRWLSLDN